MKVQCLYDALVPISELKKRFHAKNRNKHPRDQIIRLAEIMKYQGVRYPAKVSNLSGSVTSGHGRVLAAEYIGWDSFPVNYQDYEDETQEYADLQADNAIASWSDLDLSGINMDIGELGPDFDLNLLGIKNFEVDVADKDVEDEDDLYSKKIQSPIYVPTGENPKTTDLYDLSKTKTLLDEIAEAQELPEEIRTFLHFAAQRHIVFNYEKIAEYYAHAEKSVQNLMENSALVIIDFNKAIEKGFVELSDEIAKAYGHDHA